jgi:arsenate reductase (thioredoxin)
MRDEPVRKSVIQKVNHVLFVCSGNSSRSIMAESILRQLGSGRFNAYSAGTHPTGRVNPLSLEELRRRGYPTKALASKSWNHFSALDAVPLDVVITVCEKAATERHPSWPGSPINVCWKFQSPGSVQGTDKEVRAVFASVCQQIETALHAFLRVPFDELDAAERRSYLQGIVAS